MDISGKYDKDSLGTRMKEYENAYRIKLPKKSYVMIRVDGKAFHTYTNNLDRPFDFGFIEDMNQTAGYLCKNIMGAKAAFVQSDEISILLTDFEKIETEAWFDNNVQKMVSIAASMATAKFNQLRMMRESSIYLIDDLGKSHRTLNLEEIEQFVLAEFDARVWLLPSRSEVENYFIWRQQDTTRNSISSVAQSLYSHEELKGVKSDDKQELIFQKGINWNDYDSTLKRGRFIEKIPIVNGIPIYTQSEFEDMEILETDTVRNKWMVVECPIFTQDRQFLRSRIKLNG